MKKKNLLIISLCIMMIVGGIIVFIDQFDSLSNNENEDEWKSKPILEVHIEESDNLSEVIELKLSIEENELELYSNGLKVTGILDNEDFNYLCDNFESPILDLSEAIFMEREIKCRLGVNEPPFYDGPPIRMVMLPIANDEYYNLPEDFFAKMKLLEYVDMRYVNNVNTDTFYDTIIKEIVFSDRFILMNPFSESNKIISIDISGVYMFDCEAFAHSSIKEITILNNEPPIIFSIYGVRKMTGTKSMTFIYPDTEAWDGFKEELLRWGYEGKIKRIPYEEQESKKLLSLHLTEEEDLSEIFHEQYNEEKYRNGIKVTGIMDNEDFQFLCSGHDILVLDLSEAVFSEEKITCTLGSRPPSEERLSLEIVILPQSKGEYYALEDGFFAGLEQLEYVDMRYVGNTGNETFSKSNVQVVLLSDAVQIGSSAFSEAENLYRIDISGISELNSESFRNSMIGNIIILRQEPPIIIGSLDELRSGEYIRIYYPDTEAWDEFEQLLENHGYKKFITRIPYEE